MEKNCVDYNGKVIVEIPGWIEEMKKDIDAYFKATPKGGFYKTMDIG